MLMPFLVFGKVCSNHKLPHPYLPPPSASHLLLPLHFLCLSNYSRFVTMLLSIHLTYHQIWCVKSTSPICKDHIYCPWDVKILALLWMGARIDGGIIFLWVDFAVVSQWMVWKQIMIFFLFVFFNTYQIMQILQWMSC